MNPEKIFQMKTVDRTWRQISFDGKKEMAHIQDAWILVNPDQKAVGMVIQLSFGWIAINARGQHQKKEDAFLDEELYLTNNGYTFTGLWKGE